MLKPLVAFEAPALKCHLVPVRIRGSHGVGNQYLRDWNARATRWNSNPSLEKMEVGRG